MESTQRPQRQRRVPSRFLEDVATPIVSKDAAAAPQLLKRARPSGGTEPSTKRHRSSAKKATEGQGRCGPLVLLSHPGSPAVEVTRVAGSASSGEPHLDLPASVGGAARGQAAPEAQETAPVNDHNAKQGGTRSDDSDSDVMIMEPAPTAMVKVGEQEGTSALSPRPANRGAQERSTPPPPAPQASTPEPVPLAPAPVEPVATEVRASAAPPPPPPGSPAARRASGISSQSTAHEAQGEARVAVPGELPASPPPVGPSASPSGGPGPESAVFQPLFQREATPPRPDFSVGNDDASDSDSDGFDILAPRGRKGKKAAVRRPPRGSLLDTSASPAGSSPDGSVHGTPARRAASSAQDTSWLKPPSPERTVRGARSSAVPESATLLRLRQQRAELLALARGASLAPDRIQAQSTAEALERELERDAAQREAQAAAQRVKPAPDESDDEAGSAGGAAREQGGGAQSVLVKVRASDGSQERFKVRCVDPLEKLFRAYVKKVHPGGSPAGVVFGFVFDGDPIDGKSTPEDLGLEDDDMIEVVQSK